MTTQKLQVGAKVYESDERPSSDITPGSFARSVHDAGRGIHVPIEVPPCLTRRQAVELFVESQPDP
jgi:hypothetical protein